MENVLEELDICYVIMKRNLLGLYLKPIFLYAKISVYLCGSHLEL